MNGQVVFPRFFGFHQPLINGWIGISEIFLKGPENPNKKKKIRGSCFFVFNSQ